MWYICEWNAIDWVHDEWYDVCLGMIKSFVLGDGIYCTVVTLEPIDINLGIEEKGNGYVLFCHNS